MSLLEKASLVITPNATKEGKLYSVIPNAPLGDLDVVRATTATRVNSAGLIESVANNIPRLDYTNGSCPSILVEPQRTNLLLRSEEFDNVVWTKNNAPTITSNIAIAPDGTTSADGIQSLTGGAYRSISQNITVASNSTVTGSVFVKKETSETFYGGFSIVFQGGTTKTLYIIVDAVAGTGTISSSTLTGTIKVEDYGNYWRISATTTDNGSNTICKFSYESTLSTNGTTLNVGAGSVRTIWGAQLEVGLNATSYIKTEATTVTRNADLISKTGITDLIGQSEGTVFVDVDIKNTIANRIPIVISSANPGTITSEAYFYINPSGNLVFEFYSAGVAQCSISAGAVQVGVQKLAFVYKNNDFAFYRNGTLVGTDTGGTVVSGLDRFFLGCFTNSSLQLNDRIKSATIWKTRLSNETLAQLTTL
jgi:hypothetical protein